MRYAHTRILIWVILFLALLVPYGTCADRLSVDGYHKNFFVVYKLPAITVLGTSLDLPPLGSVSSRLRLNSRWRPQPGISLTLSYVFAPRVQDPLLFDNPAGATFIKTVTYRFDDLASRLYPSTNNDVSSFAIFQNLDRAFLEIRTKYADLFIGRQAIAFGSARTINPTDIFAPYSFETLDTEDRTGIDALRVRVPVGFMGEIDAGCVFGDDFKSELSAMFLRTRFRLARNDISLMASAFRENLMIGLDIGRSIGGAGVYLEGAHTFSGIFKSNESANDRDYFRATLGGDYSLGDNTYGFVEYHFNQPGADNPQEYLSKITRTAYTIGSVYLLGKHYIIPGVVCQLTPLVTASIEVLCNASDRSAYFAPGLEYNIAPSIYLSGGAYIGVGKTPGLNEPVRSEFGSYPDMFYTSFRNYF